MRRKLLAVAVVLSQAEIVASSSSRVTGVVGVVVSALSLYAGFYEPAADDAYDASAASLSNGPQPGTPT